MGETRALCVNCRSAVSVPDSYAHGDHVKCGACATAHKVLRSAAGLRLVLADVGPLKEALRETKQRIRGLESDLRTARASWGVGVNGLGLGVSYVLYQVGLKDAALTEHLLLDAGGIAMASGLLLELCNYLFLAKRKAIVRLSAEIAQLDTEASELQQRIREGSRA